MNIKVITGQGTTGQSIELGNRELEALKDRVDFIQKTKAAHDNRDQMSSEQRMQLREDDKVVEKYATELINFVTNITKDVVPTRAIEDGLFTIKEE